MRERVSIFPSFKNFLTEKNNIDVLCMDMDVLQTDKLTGSEPGGMRTEGGSGCHWR